MHSALRNPALTLHLSAQLLRQLEEAPLAQHCNLRIRACRHSCQRTPLQSLMQRSQSRHHDVRRRLNKSVQHRLIGGHRPIYFNIIIDELLQNM